MIVLLFEQKCSSSVYFFILIKSLTGVSLFEQVKNARFTEPEYCLISMHIRKCRSLLRKKVGVLFIYKDIEFIYFLFMKQYQYFYYFKIKQIPLNRTELKTSVDYFWKCKCLKIIYVYKLTFQIKEKTSESISGFLLFSLSKQWRREYTLTLNSHQVAQ